MGRKSEAQKKKERKTEIERKSHLKTCKTYSLSFHKEKDKAIIDCLDSQTSKNGYIRRLILEDLKKGH